MLKIRLMGTKSDIAWFQKILSSNNKIEVLEVSRSESFIVIKEQENITGLMHKYKK